MLSTCASVTRRGGTRLLMRIWHATRTAVSRVAMDEDLTMLFGPASDGALLEIGVLDIEGDDPVIIHAMALRSKFYRFLGSGGDHHATHRR